MSLIIPRLFMAELVIQLGHAFNMCIKAAWFWSNTLSFIDMIKCVPYSFIDLIKWFISYVSMSAQKFSYTFYKRSDMVLYVSFQFFISISRQCIDIVAHWVCQTVRGTSLAGLQSQWIPRVTCSNPRPATKFCEDCEILSTAISLSADPGRTVAS